MKKQKANRTKWTIERAKQLENERITTPLTYSELGKKNGMTGSAIKASIQRYLAKEELVEKYIAPPAGTTEEQIIEYAIKQKQIHQSMIKAWDQILAK